MQSKSTHRGSGGGGGELGPAGRCPSPLAVSRILPGFGIAVPVLIAPSPRTLACTVASQITHHLESLPVRRANLLRRPLRLHSPPPPTIRPALWAIRQKRMVELLDVFDVRPADEEEGEEDEDWVIGGGLVLPGRRQDLDGTSLCRFIPASSKLALT